MNLKCPKCKGTMAALHHDGMKVERCTKCGGLFFEDLGAKQLKRMPGDQPRGKSPEEIREGREQGEAKCPFCGDVMVKMVDNKRPHVWYEFCPDCDGVFFAAGEYEQYRNESIGQTCERLFATGNKK